MVVAGWCGTVEARLVVLGQPVGEELLDGVGLDDSTGQDVGAELAGLLEEQDAEVLISGFVRELFEADGGRETCWTCRQRTPWLDGQELDERADNGTIFQYIGSAPPPTMHTSTWSLSRSIVAGSKESSGVAMRRDVLTENSLACVVLLVAAYDWRNIVLRGKHVVIARGHCACDLALAIGVAALAKRPDILAGADMMCRVWDVWRRGWRVGVGGDGGGWRGVFVTILEALGKGYALQPKSKARPL